MVRTAGERIITSGRASRGVKFGGWMFLLWWPLRLFSQPLSSNEMTASLTIIQCYAMLWSLNRIENMKA